MRVTIRTFAREDIPKKVEWINNPLNHQFLHYDLPLEVGRTECWFERNVGRKDRYDGVIEADGVPVGLIGLLSIDGRNQRAEYYISMGEAAYKGKGIAKEASWLLLKYGFEELGLNRIYLYTEVGNTAARRLFERVGFIKEGVLRQDVRSSGAVQGQEAHQAEMYADRIIYGMLRMDYFESSALRR
jgi:diamine N-acetyltransferase